MHKPWFNKKCLEKRKAFIKAKRKARNNSCLHTIEDRKKTNKEYKKCVKTELRKYQCAFVKSLRKLKSSDPRKYWNILKSKTDFNNKRTDKPSCSTFLKHFSNLQDNSRIPTVNREDDESGSPDSVSDCSPLNVAFTIEEVQKCISKLQNNKACGSDKIINEFLKTSAPKLFNVFTLLFNLILKTGIVPSIWTVGVIKPIFKQKGSTADPNNYRGITILSCFGKLFTSVLNERLKDFISVNNLLGNEQAGFRSGFSTVDHIFTLYGMIDILLGKKARLHCAFLDYEKAFDKVDRAFLWEKLLSFGIQGKILNVVKNLYSNAKSCVMTESNCSDYFQTSTGVRQGENLSPLLFALFLADLKGCLADAMAGLHSLTKESLKVGMSECEVNIMFKLFILLYADDTVICSETPENLQKGLDYMYEYCNVWKLKLNPKKCKMVIFSRGKVRKKNKFYNWFGICRDNG